MAGAMTRWDPLADLVALRGRFDRLFDELGDRPERGWMPAVDIVRTNGRLVVRPDVPGMKPEDIKVEVEDGVLTVSGQYDESAEDKDEDVLRRERRYGVFSRSLVLPDGVETDSIQATTKDGVLEVTIPLPEEKGPEKVTITPSAGS
jgi:HSP20 family protein